MKTSNTLIKKINMFKKNLGHLLTPERFHFCKNTSTISDKNVPLKTVFVVTYFYHLNSYIVLQQSELHSH